MVKQNQKDFNAKVLNWFGIPALATKQSLEDYEKSGQMFALPIAFPFPDPQQGAGRRIKSALENTLVDRLCLHATMTFYTLRGLGLNEDEARDKIQTVVPALSVSTLLDNGRKLIPELTGALSAREMNCYQRSKTEIMKNNGIMVQPEAGVTHEILVLELLNTALTRARNMSQDAYEFRKKTEAGDVPTDEEMIRAFLGIEPNPRPLYMLWIAAHGQVNPADMWPNFEFARVFYNPAISLGRLLLAQCIETTDVEIERFLEIYLDEIDRELESPTEEQNILIVLRDWIKLTIGEEQLSYLVGQVRSGVKKTIAAPFQTRTT